MRTLKLFNAVLAKETQQLAFVSEQGFVIEPLAVWAKRQILDYYTSEQLDGNDLNKTFHKSWDVIKNSSRFELYLHQIMHYLSTYGSDFQDEVYIPKEVLDVPNVDLKFKVIRAYTVEEMTEKCLNMLRSGVAMSEETLNDLLFILVNDLSYKFTGSEGIRNKEAVIRIADIYGVYPQEPVDFFRYVVYKATGQTLLIKNDNLIEAIKASNLNPSLHFVTFGLKKLAEVFNRFKPLFLAFKDKCPSTINKIAKLSKKYHKPLVSNPLSTVTSRLLCNDDTHWLDNATPFALFRAMNLCYTRMRSRSSFVYRIRNGKSWATEKEMSEQHISTIRDNYIFLRNYVTSRLDLSGVNIYLPKGVEYSLPTSEKMFIGNVPTGTQFFAKNMAVGVYWENEWGASDLDLSGLNIGGKVGWNSAYSQNEGSLMYSGDITDARNGAVEYLYAQNGLNSPTLVLNNVFSGSPTCEYKVVIGSGDGIDRKYMMNPNNLFAEIKCKSVEKQNILGIVIPDGYNQRFVLLGFGAGSANVSGNGKVSDIATVALYQQYIDPLRFRDLVELLGANIVSIPQQATYDLSLDNLDKDSFTKIFKD